MTTLVVADVDGTLVDHRGIPYPGLTALTDLAARPGFELALASARPPWSLEQLAARLGPMVTGVSGFQGAIVQAADGPGGWRRLRTLPLAPQAVTALDDTLDRRLSRWWYTPREWYVSRDDAAARDEARVVGRPWSGVRDRPPDDDPVLKVMAVGDPDLVAAASPAHPGVRSAVSKPIYLEIVNAEIDPDKGIAALRAGRPDIARVIAVGDGANDIGMLRAADRGFTFADAPAALRHVATTVLPAARDRAFAQLAACSG